ncbi:MAG TPA: alpha/beta fold hydrolase [Thermoanaerobaculia bacterium]|nr:alpha/beta fold hydrolase [Thermoanaerobaculia bacterium]
MNPAFRSRPWRWLRRTLLVFAGLGSLAFFSSLLAVLWGDPEFGPFPAASADELAALARRFEQPYGAAHRDFHLRDGTRLSAQQLECPEAKRTLLLVHGLLGSSLLLNRPAGLLREAAHAEVVALDLRGHGGSSGAPGDVDSIGQYEADLAEVIAQLRAAQPERQLILAGHSMGGGIALRYAQLRGAPAVEGYLLFAPYLGWDAPSTRHEPPPGADPAGADFLRLNLPRILGLKLLNAVGITAFNGLRTEFFNLPPELPLRSYSFRASESMAPKNARAALAAVDAPLLVVVGGQDEAFLPEAYPALLQGLPRAEAVVIPGASHDGVLEDPQALRAVASWALLTEGPALRREP